MTLFQVQDLPSVVKQPFVPSMNIHVNKMSKFLFTDYLDFGHMALVQGHDIPVPYGHKQPLCHIWPSNVSIKLWNGYIVGKTDGLT